MSHSLRIAAVLLVCLITQTVSAQRIGNSPYSQIGIGEIYYPGYAPNYAMGGAGTAYANGIFINNVNPALLVRNRSTAFDIGFFGGWKQLQTQQASQRDLNLNLNYLSMAFPAARRWTLGINLAPYSAVNYQIVSNGTVAGTAEPAQYNYRGFGGLNAVSFNNGVAIYRKEDKEGRLTRELSLGLQASYIFGALTKESISRVGADTTVGYHVASVRRTNYSDFVFKPGVAYRHRFNDRAYWTIGASYDITRELQGNQLNSIQYRIDADAEPISTDTLSSGVAGTVKLPGGYQFGVSIEDPLRWAVAADVSFRRWTDLRTTDSATLDLRNAMSVSLGGEWTPNANSLNSYLKRSTYRFGVNYTQMPVSTPQGRQLRDVSVRAGMFFPITPADRRTLSYLNLAVAVGQRGTLDSGLVRERYVNFVFGFTINDFGWFLKPKID